MSDNDAPRPRGELWREQADALGVVHVLRGDDRASATSLQTMAKRYARAHGLRVETRVFGDVALFRWTPMD